ncbi:hypothetical protein MOKP126_51130 [Mycobacterium avium subsp. hominissuis]
MRSHCAHGPVSYDRPDAPAPGNDGLARDTATSVRFPMVRQGFGAAGGMRRPPEGAGLKGC